MKIIEIQRIFVASVSKKYPCGEHSRSWTGYLKSKNEEDLVSLLVHPTFDRWIMEKKCFHKMVACQSRKSDFRKKNCSYSVDKNRNFHSKNEIFDQKLHMYI